MQFAKKITLISMCYHLLNCLLQYGLPFMIIGYQYFYLGTSLGTAAVLVKEFFLGKASVLLLDQKQKANARVYHRLAAHCFNKEILRYLYIGKNVKVGKPSDDSSALFHFRGNVGNRKLAYGISRLEIHLGLSVLFLFFNLLLFIFFTSCSKFMLTSVLNMLWHWSNFSCLHKSISCHKRSY